MPDNTPKLVMPYIVASQAQKEVSHNEALNILDVVVQPTCINLLFTPPGSPAQGDTYIISGGTATGAWVGRETFIAAYYDTWIFIEPQTGWEFTNQADGFTYRFNGTGWAQKIYTPGAWQIPSLGLGWIGLGGAWRNPRYRKDQSGMVTIEGAMQRAVSALDGVIFTLLSGYRPAADLIFGGYSAGGSFRINVKSNGDVEVSGSNMFFSSFSGIQFYTD